MRIHILSDLHFETSKMDQDYVPPECDVVVLAGDISPGLPGVKWAMDTFTVPVIYILGNHEFWGMRGYRDYIAKLKAYTAGSNVHVLYDDTVVIGDTRFVGATLWTDMNLFGDKYNSSLICHMCMYDFDNMIHVERLDAETGARDFFTVNDALDEHQNSRDYIHMALLTPFHGKTVVVTHHGPSFKSIAPKYQSNPTTPAYASHMDGMIMDTQPALWIHGHVHDRFDYQIGDTRVIVNPRGYKSRNEGMDFDPQLVVEI